MYIFLLGSSVTFLLQIYISTLSKLEGNMATWKEPGLESEIHESEPILTYDELTTLSFALLICKMSILELCRWNEIIQN